MILWINGAFGSGKSSVAEELNKNIEKSFVYDPEQVGYFLWDNFPKELKRKGNFQHLPIWREMNYKILKHIDSNYDGVIISPQTIYTKQYYDEIIGKLIKDNVEVKHLVLSATKQTIIKRLISRGEAPNSWPEQHIDKCLKAFNTDIKGLIIDTENKNIMEIVNDIISKCNLH